MQFTYPSFFITSLCHLLQSYLAKLALSLITKIRSCCFGLRAFSWASDLQSIGKLPGCFVTNYDWPRIKAHPSPLYFPFLLGSYGSRASQLLGQEPEGHFFLTLPSCSFIQSCYYPVGHSVFFLESVPLLFVGKLQIYLTWSLSLSFYSSWNSALQVFTFFLSVHLLSLHSMLSHDFLDLFFNSVSLSSDVSSRFDLWTMNFNDCILCCFIKFSL